MSRAEADDHEHHGDLEDPDDRRGKHGAQRDPAGRSVRGERTVGQWPDEQEEHVGADPGGERHEERRKTGAVGPGAGDGVVAHVDGIADRACRRTRGRVVQVGHLGQALAQAVAELVGPRVQLGRAATQLRAVLRQLAGTLRDLARPRGELGRAPLLSVRVPRTSFVAPEASSEPPEAALETPLVRAGGVLRELLGAGGDLRGALAQLVELGRRRPRSWRRPAGTGDPCHVDEPGQLPACARVSTPWATRAIELGVEIGSHRGRAGDATARATAAASRPKAATRALPCATRWAPFASLRLLAGSDAVRRLQGAEPGGQLRRALLEPGRARLQLGASPRRCGWRRSRSSRLRWRAGRCP